MKASILIPAYNAQYFLEQTLESCVLQGREYVHEIILIDDHSEDRTIDVAKEFAKSQPDFNFVIETNAKKGACAARNYALSIASGDAIQWLDADDILGEGKLKRQLSLLRSNPEFLIASKWRRFSGNLTNLHPEEKGNWTEVPNTSSPTEWLFSERMMIPAGWLGTAAIFQKTGPWDESLQINQDGEFFTRAIAASQGVMFEPASRVYYRSGISGSVSHFHPKKALSLFKSCQSFERVALSISSKKEVGPYISNKYQDFINLTYPLEPELREQAQNRIEIFGKPTRGCSSRKRPLVKLVYSLFGWNALVFLRKLKHTLTRS